MCGFEDCYLSPQIYLQTWQNLNDYSSWFFVEIDRPILKFIWKCKGQVPKQHWKGGIKSDLQHLNSKLNIKMRQTGGAAHPRGRYPETKQTQKQTHTFRTTSLLTKKPRQSDGARTTNGCSNNWPHWRSDIHPLPLTKHKDQSPRTHKPKS